jgi:hypothetical protein
MRKRKKKLTTPTVDHGYITFGYLDIDINDNDNDNVCRYTSSSTQRPRHYLRPRHSRYHGSTEKAPEGNADDDNEKRMEARDFKSSPFHSRYD